jgi:hypothetical protein
MIKKIRISTIFYTLLGLLVMSTLLLPTRRERRRNDIHH